MQRNIYVMFRITYDSYYFQTVAVEDWVRSQCSPCEIYGGPSGTRTNFCSGISVFPRHCHYTSAYSLYLCQLSTQYNLSNSRCHSIKYRNWSTRLKHLQEQHTSIYGVLRIMAQWSSGQSFWLQIQRSRVRFPALPDFLSNSGSGTGFTQPREVNWGATWIKSSGSGLENRD